MQENTNKRKKIAPIVSAIVIATLLGLFLAAIIFPLVKELWGITIAVGILIVYGLTIIAVILGIFSALHQRLREIDNGEEEAAKKY